MKDQLYQIIIDLDVCYEPFLPDSWKAPERYLEFVLSECNFNNGESPKWLMDAFHSAIEGKAKTEYFPREDFNGVAHLLIELKESFGWEIVDGGDGWVIYLRAINKTIFIITNTEKKKGKFKYTIKNGENG